MRNSCVRWVPLPTRAKRVCTNQTCLISDFTCHMIFFVHQRVWKSRAKRFPCCNLFLFCCVKILLCEKAFRILLRPIREAKRVSQTWKKSVRPLTNHGLSELCFAVIAFSFAGQLWQDNIFGVLELFVIQTYQELGYIFEDGWTIKKICVSRQTYGQIYRRPKKQEHSLKDTKSCKFADWVYQLQKWEQKNQENLSMYKISW